MLIALSCCNSVKAQSMKYLYNPSLTPLLPANLPEYTAESSSKRPGESPGLSGKYQGGSLEVLSKRPGKSTEPGDTLSRQMQGKQTWYRVPFFVTEPSRTVLKLQTNGYCIAYINGRVVTDAAFWPVRQLNDSTLLTGIERVEYDVTHLIRKENNILALWVAPSSSDIPLVSATMIAEAEYGDNVLVDAESSWRCRNASSITTEKGEDMHGDAYDSGWKKTTRDVGGMWREPARALLIAEAWHEESQQEYVHDAVVTPDYVYTNADDSTKTQRFCFRNKAQGQLRITLRQAGYGQRLDINGMHYTCTGEDDEQFFTRFATIDTSEIELKAEADDALPEVWSVEVLKLRKRPVSGFLKYK